MKNNKEKILETWDNGIPKNKRVLIDKNSYVDYSYYPSGSLKTEQTIVKNKREGDYIRYWKNGEKSDHTCFKNGKEDGPTILYNKEGKIWLKGQYSNGNKTGEWIFHDSDGSVTHKENF